MPLSRTCVGVVFGGASGEHNVSIKSAITVISALKHGENENRYEVIPTYIDQKGRWWSAVVAKQVLSKGFAADESELPTPIPPPGFRELPKESKKVDIWYPVLHGPNGEDGTVQGLFKLTGKPFVGSDVLGSAIGMDKLAMKAAFSAAGLPQVPYIGTCSNEISNDCSLNHLVKHIEDSLTYPYFVKPANLGSSVGISKAHCRQELLEGIKKASTLDTRLVIEQGVIARELECAVIGKRKIQVSEIGEIHFDSDWYDYETKYSNNSCKYVIPAPLPNEIEQKIKEITIEACKAIAAKGMARVDFFYKEEEDALWINEINTLPGFTSQSMYPLLWEVSGLTLDKLVAHLVDSAGE